MPAYDYWCDDCRINKIHCQAAADGGPISIPCPSCNKPIKKRWSGFGGLVYNERPSWLDHHEKGTVAVVAGDTEAERRFIETPTRENQERMFREDKLQWYEGSGYSSSKRRARKDKERREFIEAVTAEAFDRSRDLGSL